jgi:DNA processing protein
MNPDHHARLQLLALTGMGPVRAAWLLRGGDAFAAVDALRAGRLPDELGPPPPGVSSRTVAKWRTELRGVDLSTILAAHDEFGIEIVAPSDERWPFAGDPEPPALLFALGELDLLGEVPAVAVVGTRRCTALGRTVAYRMGSDIARAGGVVVSGLALGVDGAAHRGALDHDGGVIGVVGSGLDVVYPRANRPLWDDVAERGLLLSESPAGTRPDRWRFPARNRLIAALGEAVVVVESHRRGGALSTVDEAIDRDRPVMAVPGSVLSAASDGTNALLVDGAIPVRDAADVLDYLGYRTAPAPGRATDGAAGPDLRLIEGGIGPADPDPTVAGADGDAEGEPGGGGDRGLEAQILAEVATGPVHVDRLVLATGRSVAEVMAAVQRLQAAGRVEIDGSTVSLPGWSR